MRLSHSDAVQSLYRAHDALLEYHLAVSLRQRLETLLMEADELTRKVLRAGVLRAINECRTVERVKKQEYDEANREHDALQAQRYAMIASGRPLDEDA